MHSFFFYKNGIKYSQVLKKLNVAFGESTMGKIRVSEWHKRFQEGREDDEHSGRPSTTKPDENAEKLTQVVTTDH